MKQNLEFVINKYTEKIAMQIVLQIIIRFLRSILSLTLYYQNLEKDLRRTKLLFLVFAYHSVYNGFFPKLDGLFQRILQKFFYKDDFENTSLSPVDGELQLWK